MKSRKTLLILSASLVVGLVGCARNTSHEEQSDVAVEVVQEELVSIHQDVFGIPMSLDTAAFSKALGLLFHDTIETKRSWGNKALATRRIVNVLNLSFAVDIDTIGDKVAKVTLTSPYVAIDETDSIGVEAALAIYKHIASTYNEPEKIQRVPWRADACTDWITEGGWIRYTWDGCCAIRSCTIEFIDKENSIQMFLGVTNRSDIKEDSCALGHYYYANGNQVFDFEHGLFPFQFEDELIVVPQYRGGKFLQKKFGKGSYYAARVKNSQYPKLYFPKDQSIEYNPDKDDLELFTADSSSVVARVWQLPDSTGYLYYVAHQDYYIDMLPTWTTLIYSPTSLTKKFIHKNYKVDNFMPTDKRY